MCPKCGKKMEHLLCNIIGTRESKFWEDGTYDDEEIVNEVRQYFCPHCQRILARDETAALVSLRAHASPV